MNIPRPSHSDHAHVQPRHPPLQLITPSRSPYHTTSSTPTSCRSASDSAPHHAVSPSPPNHLLTLAILFPTPLWPTCPPCHTPSPTHPTQSHPATTPRSKMSFFNACGTPSCPFRVTRPVIATDTNQTHHQPLAIRSAHRTTTFQAPKNFSFSFVSAICLNPSPAHLGSRESAASLHGIARRMFKW